MGDGGVARIAARRDGRRGDDRFGLYREPRQDRRPAGPGRRPRRGAALRVPSPSGAFGATGRTLPVPNRARRIAERSRARGAGGAIAITPVAGYPPGRSATAPRGRRRARGPGRHHHDARRREAGERRPLRGRDQAARLPLAALVLAEVAVRPRGRHVVGDVGGMGAPPAPGRSRRRRGWSRRPAIRALGPRARSLLAPASRGCGPPPPSSSPVPEPPAGSTRRRRPVQGRG